MAKQDPLKINFETLTVMLKPPEIGDHGLYDVESLDTDDEYIVIASYIHRYRDGSRIPAFLIDTPVGIIARACTIFKVVECNQAAPLPPRPLIDVDLYAADCANSMGDVFYDPEPNVDGCDPTELREEVESSVRYTIRKLMAALGYPASGTATLRVPQSVADQLRELRTEYIAINEMLDSDAARSENWDRRIEIFEKQTEIGIELASMLLDMVPTMEVYQ